MLFFENVETFLKSLLDLLFVAYSSTIASSFVFAPSESSYKKSTDLHTVFVLLIKTAAKLSISAINHIHCWQSGFSNCQ